MIPSSLEALVTPKEKAALDFALSNIGVCEDPPGSNRGPGDRRLDNGVRLTARIVLVRDRRRQGAQGWRAVDSRSRRRVVRRVGVSSVPEIARRVGADAGLRGGLHERQEVITTGRYAGQLDAVHIGLVLRAKPVAAVDRGEHDAREVRHERLHAGAEGSRSLASALLHRAGGSMTTRDVVRVAVAAGVALALAFIVEHVRDAGRDAESAPARGESSRATRRHASPRPRRRTARSRMRTRRSATALAPTADGIELARLRRACRRSSRRRSPTR
jgi:hypothetical protein